MLLMPGSVSPPREKICHQGPELGCPSEYEVCSFFSAVSCSAVLSHPRLDERITIEPAHAVTGAAEAVVVV